MNVVAVHCHTNFIRSRSELLTFLLLILLALRSPQCYTSDRQLSLDLVNVGRQRLDFLPMLEHSGTYRETAVHTGTFAQEIITLVHLVKGQHTSTASVAAHQNVLG